MKTDTYLQPSDLVGCRYRQVQRRRFPDVSVTENSQLRRERLLDARRAVFDLLPTKPQIGDPQHFLRLDLRPDYPARVDHEDVWQTYLQTLEAIANQATIITGAVLIGESEGVAWRAELDALIRRPDGCYLPLLVSNHRVARPARNAADQAKTVRMIATARLGLGQAYKVATKLKHHSIDSFTLGLAAQALDSLGVGCRRALIIGQSSEQAFVLNTDYFQQGLTNALRATIPDLPRRVKECASCRFVDLCGEQLRERDDLSLFLSGDRANPFRERGIDTVQGLIDARLGRPSELAAAWRAHIPVLAVTEHVDHERFDVEIDIDVEAYLDHGAYLWGAYDGDTYHPFVTWEPLGGQSEGENFARFWAWLMGRRYAAEQAGQTFGAFCYSAHGENHWLRFSARRFHGKVEGVPSEAEVLAFIQSGQWHDVFVAVKNNLVGPEGLGLKVVAPAAGFSWEANDVDGEASVNLYREAVGLDTHVDAETSANVRATLLSYNGDDCRATAAVRWWLNAGAPGVPLLNTMLH